MKLYHGTYLQFDAVDLSKSNKGKDFGKGFYLSDNYEQAHNLAIFKSIQFDTAPIVLPFEFDERNLTNGELKNRLYNANSIDKVGFQIRNLLENNIDMNVFLERLKYMQGITFQYFFGTEKAVKLLKRL